MDQESTTEAHAVQEQNGHNEAQQTGNGEQPPPEAPQPRRPSTNIGTSSNSILARLNFLRTSFEDSRPTIEDLHSQGLSLSHDGTGPEHGSGRVQKPVKTRRRTGSLRKTAILGTGRMKVENRERRNSLLRASDGTASSSSDGGVPLTTTTEPASSSTTAFPPFFPPPVAAPATTSPTLPSLSLDTTSPTSPPSTLLSPGKSPTSASVASTTTDDDDLLSFSRPSAPVLPSSSGSSAYFPSPEVAGRRGTAPLSPLSALPMDFPPALAHSYSETEWWGWVVLVTTWLFFVIGMGSCLDIWSWAWDVGETPYAPPELEDDPTLPIVGYYPALIILSAVMAWVWVVVAWVGMKYFKHAKIPGDD